MAEIKMTPEEEKIFLLVKKSILNNKDNRFFLLNLNYCLDNVFNYKCGSKTIHFNKNGKICRIESHKVEYSNYDS